MSTTPSNPPIRRTANTILSVPARHNDCAKIGISDPAEEFLLKQIDLMLAGRNFLRDFEYPFDDIGCQIQSGFFSKDVLEPTRFITVARI
jgi:hypothetical protein